MVRIALAGDTMLGRLCADTVAAGDTTAAFADEVVRAAAGSDLFVANLECCISERGERWPDPRKPFFFRCPPAGAQLLADVGVDVVTLANNHALDYGEDALLDTLQHLAAAGIDVVGAGADSASARAPLAVDAGGTSITIIGVADHPAGFAAAADRPGTAYADLAAGTPGWLTDLVAGAARSADVVLVTPHWGPNMTTTPVPHVRRAAHVLVEAGATLVAGHSAHVLHGVAWDRSACVLYDLGDFYDDYAVDPVLRNDLGALWIVEIEDRRPVAVDALPLHLQTCRTVVAGDDDAAWVETRLRRACEAFGTAVARVEGAPVLRCTPARG